MFGSLSVLFYVSYNHLGLLKASIIGYLTNGDHLFGLLARRFVLVTGRSAGVISQCPPRVSLKTFVFNRRPPNPDSPNTQSSIWGAGDQGPGMQEDIVYCAPSSPRIFISPRARILDSGPKFNRQGFLREVMCRFRKVSAPKMNSPELPRVLGSPHFSGVGEFWEPLFLRWDAMRPLDGTEL